MRKSFFNLRIRYQPLLAMGIVLIALGLRLITLTRVGLWIDEASSVAIAKLPVSELVIASSNDPHPPVYYLALHGWTRLLGNSEFAVRLLSVFAGVLAVALMYRLTRELLTSAASLLAIWIIAFSPALIAYSQETRMYSLLCALAVLFVWLALRVGNLPSVTNTKLKLVISIAYVIIGIVGLYTHDYFAFVLVAVNGWMLARMVAKRSWVQLPSWAFLQFLILLGFLPWLPVVIYQSQHFRFTWLSSPTLIGIPNTITYLVAGQSQLSGAALAWLIALVIFILGGLTIRNLAKLKRWPEIILLLCWSILPILIIFILAQATPVYLNRSFLFATPAFLMLVVGGVSQHRRLALILVLAIPLVYLLPLRQFYFEVPKQQWRELAQYLQDHSNPNDAVYINPLGGRVALDYYNVDMPIAGYPPDFDLRLGGFHGEQTTQSDIGSQFGLLTSQYDRIWLVEFTASFWDPNGYITSWLDQHAVQEPIPEFWGLFVRLYRLRH